jgi:hypothetical protein
MRIRVLHRSSKLPRVSGDSAEVREQRRNAPPSGVERAILMSSTHVERALAAQLYRGEVAAPRQQPGRLVLEREVSCRR